METALAKSKTLYNEKELTESQERFATKLERKNKKS
jgi:hypothetical protein